MWPFYWDSPLDFVHNDSTIQLATEDKNRTISLSSLVKASTPPFHAHPLFCTGLLQTFKTTLSHFDLPIHYSRETVTTEDGSSYTIDHAVAAHTADQVFSPELPPRTRHLTSAPRPDDGDTTPMIIILHGLSGGSHEIYVRELIEPAQKNGFIPVVLNARGCALSKVTTGRLFNAMFTADLRRTVKMLHARYPNRELYGVGYSLGANILGNYIGEEGDKSVLKAAVLISSPHNLDVSGKVLHQGWIGREVLSKTMASNLKNLFELNKGILLPSDQINVEEVRASRYLYEFDAAFTSRLFGFPTVDDYYRTASSVRQYKNIRTPTFVLNALDDPIAVKEALPYLDVRANEYMTMVVTGIGGHLGWFDAQGKRWFTKPVMSFLEGMRTSNGIVKAEKPDVPFINPNGESKPNGEY